MVTTETGPTDSWSEHFPNKLPGLANHNAMQIDPHRDVIVVSVHARNELYAIDPTDPAREIVQLNAAGAKPTLHPYASMQYAPNLDRIVYFSPLDGGTVYTIAAPTATIFVDPWTWHALRPASNTLDPIHDAASRSSYPVNLSQTFGRFRIASYGEIDLALLVRHVDSPVYAMRLT